MEEEIIAKNSKTREMAESNGGSDATVSDGATSEVTTGDVLDGERPEMPEEMGEMGDAGGMGGPMGGGGFPGEMTMVQNETNEWLAPMVGAGITSGVVIIAAVVIGWMIMRLEKKIKKIG